MAFPDTLEEMACQELPTLEAGDGLELEGICQELPTLEEMAYQDMPP
jgi:hypothetical protein